MSGGTTYDARVYRTEVYKGKEVTTYHVRWKVGRIRLHTRLVGKITKADRFRRSQATICGSEEWVGRVGLEPTTGGL